MNNGCFSIEFERRLSDLRDYINVYFLTGRESNILPCLWKCVSLIWSMQHYKKSYLRKSNFR